MQITKSDETKLTKLSSDTYLGVCGLIRSLTDSLNYYLVMDFEDGVKDHSMLARMQVEVLHEIIDNDGSFKDITIGNERPSRYLTDIEASHPFTKNDIVMARTNNWVSILVPTLANSTSPVDGTIALYKSLLLFLSKGTFEKYYFYIGKDTVIDLRATAVYLAFRYSGDSRKLTEAAIKKITGKSITDFEVSNHCDSKSSDRFKSKILLLPVQCMKIVTDRIPSLTESARWNPIVISENTFDELYAYIS